MKRREKGFLASAILVEFGIIAVLVILISATLNYFNIIPLSSTFSFLSFLPRQSVLGQLNGSKVLNSQGNKNNAAQSLKNTVIKSSPLIVKNDDSKTLFQPIKYTPTKVTPGNKIRIDVNLAIIEQGSSNDQYTGLIFADDLIKTDAKTLLLFYNPKNKTWGLQYKHGTKVNYIPLFENSSSEIFANLSLYIDADGKKVYAVLPDKKSKVLILEESIYESTDQIKITTRVAPKDTLKINSLIIYPTVK